MEILQFPFLLTNWFHEERLLATAATLVVALSLFLSHYAFSSHRKLPPGPRGWPILGNAHQMGSHPHRTLQALHKKYGHILFVRLGSIPTVVVDSPELVAEVMKVQDNVLCSRPSTTFTHLVAYDAQDFIMAPYGPHWRYMRRICVNELLTPKRLENTAKERGEEVAATVRKVFETEGLQDLRSLLAGTAMRVMCRMILGRREFTARGGEKKRDFHPLIEELTRLMGAFVLRDFVPWLGWLDVKGYERDMRKLRIALDEVLNEIVQEHRDLASGKLPGGNPNDFVSTLLESPGENGAPHLDGDAIKAITIDMVAAGTDTSAVSNEWAMSEIIRNPEIQRKLHAELDAVIGRDRNVEESDLLRLPYLMCVIKESLRMHPPGPFTIPREAMSDTTIHGYHIAKGTRVIINLFSLGHSSENWSDPFTFNPDRWKDGNLTSFFDPAMRIAVFGYGKRQCPGYHLATTMVLLVLARLFHGFQWSLPPGVTPENFDMADDYGFTCPRRTRLRAIATPRLPPHLYVQ